MGISEATLRLLVTMKDEASAGLGSLTGALGTLGTAGLAVAAAGVAALGAGIAAGVGDAQEARRLYASTEQTIKTMGNAAGISAQQVVDLASGLSDAAGKSLFGDDQIQQSENLLLTFGNIKGETFELATALTTDLAQALGGAPADQAMMLGKALNDPIKGISALGKAGLTFSEDQKAAIKAMVESGDVAGAQAVIIKELNSQVGGQAAAAAQAAGGMVQFKAALGETFETIGSKLLPVLDQLGVWLNSPEVQTAIATFAENLGNGITIAAAWITDTLIPVLGQVWAYLQTNVIPILAEVVAWLAVNVPPAIAATADFITNTLIPAFQTVWAFIQTNVIPILMDIVTWFATNIPPAMAVVSAFITGTLIPAFQSVWAFLQENVIPILMDVVTWLATNVPPAMAAVSSFITGTLVPAFKVVWAFIQDNVIPIIKQLAGVEFAALKLAAQAVANIWTSVLQPALSAVWSFIQDNVIPIIVSLVSTHFAALKLAAQGIATFWTGTLQPAFAAVSTFLSTTATSATNGFKLVLDGVKTSFDYVTDAVATVQRGIEKLVAFWDSIKPPDWIVGHSPPPLADWFSMVGESVSGVTDMLAGFASIMQDAASAAVASFHDLSGLGLNLGGNTIADVFGGGSTKGSKGPNLDSLPHFAGGVRNFRGGAAWVGEDGPELVDLPGGSSVIPNGGIVGGQIVRIIFDAGEFAKYISARVEEASTDSGGRALSRIRTGN